MSETAQAIQDFFDRQAPGRMGSIVLASERSELIVYRKPPADLDQQIRTLKREQDQFTLSIRDARLSAEEMQRLVLRITSEDLNYWGSRNITVNGAFPAEDASVLNVLVARADPAAVQTQFDERYGAGVTVVSRGNGAVPAVPAIGGQYSSIYFFESASRQGSP